jgi:hypothetical protein
MMAQLNNYAFSLRKVTTNLINMKEKENIFRGKVIKELKELSRMLSVQWKVLLSILWCVNFSAFYGVM